MFLATIPAVLYIDKIGRKPVLVSGAIWMATCHFVRPHVFRMRCSSMLYSRLVLCVRLDTFPGLRLIKSVLCLCQVIGGLSGAYQDSWPSHTAAGWVACSFVWIFVVGVCVISLDHAGVCVS
jgi:hypothetical protein